MGKIMKKGRVVILTSGRQAGKKAVIVTNNDLGSKKTRTFAHALVVGVERPPRQVTKRMTSKKFDRKCRMKPFVKFVNYNHMMPTRFVLKDDLEFKNVVSEEKFAPKDSATYRKTIKKDIKKMLQARYLAPEASQEKQSAVDFLFKKLRF